MQFEKDPFEEVGTTLDLMLQLEKYCTDKGLNESWKKISKATNDMLTFRSIWVDYRYAKYRYVR